MTGDAAGMITPLCGNGMAMAIHSAKILSEYLIRYCGERSYSRENLETRLYGCLEKKFFGAAEYRTLRAALVRSAMGIIIGGWYDAVFKTDFEIHYPATHGPVF